MGSNVINIMRGAIDWLLLWALGFPQHNLTLLITHTHCSTTFVETKLRHGSHFYAV